VSARFKARYCTLSFQDAANLDDGAMLPTSFALIELTPRPRRRSSPPSRRLSAGLPPRAATHTSNGAPTIWAPPGQSPCDWYLTMPFR
jgi:hypothetical protein